MIIAAATNKNLFISHRLDTSGGALQPAKLSTPLCRQGRLLWLSVPSRYSGDET